MTWKKNTNFIVTNFPALENNMSQKNPNNNERLSTEHFIIISYLLYLSNVVDMVFILFKQSSVENQRPETTIIYGNLNASVTLTVGRWTKWKGFFMPTIDWRTIGTCGILPCNKCGINSHHCEITTPMLKLFVSIS